MQGLFDDAPLIGVMELVHVSRRTGTLITDTDIPFTLRFLEGELIEGGILDWLGLDAIYAAPLVPTRGSFSFTVQDPAELGAREPLAPYGKLTADWARYSDEWTQLCRVIGSPSRVFEGQVPMFDVAGGRSVRAVARSTQVPLFEVAERVAGALPSGRLRSTGAYSWAALRLRAPQRGPELAGDRVAAALDGSRTLGDLLADGLSADLLRQYVLAEVQGGLRFPGSGWVLRDMLWEQEWGG